MWFPIGGYKGGYSTRFAKFGASCLREEFQIADGSSDRELELMAVDDSAEMSPATLPPPGLSQKVLVLAERSSPQFRRSFEGVSIRLLRRAVDLRRQHINPPEKQTTCDCRRDVHIHVQADAHVSLPSSRSLLRIGDSPASS